MSGIVQVWIKYHIRLGDFWNVCEICILSDSWKKIQINIFWDKKEKKDPCQKHYESAKI